jgi:regulator of protease activity HflC (stomatin/prohibitin superfamily)
MATASGPRFDHFSLKGKEDVMKNEIIIKDTHRGLWYVDGVLERVLEAGHYEVPAAGKFLWKRRPRIEVVLVDMRERELTIKGQEILTSDKVAIRVSIIVQFRVVDPKAAIHEVQNYEERIYGDVQLAARRSLALMTLDLILTNRNQLSEEILRDVKEVAKRYGVEIQRADVKDLTFPGNLQEVMNKVLAAERMSQVQLVEARTKAAAQQIESEAKLAAQARELDARAHALRTAAEAEATVLRIKTDAELTALRERAEAAPAYASHPALLRLRELETLNELGRSGNARLYVDFDRRMVDE